MIRLLIAVGITLYSLTSFAAEDDSIFSPSVVVRNESDFGAQVGYFACPCFRWTIRVELLGGKIETREILISSDALFQYVQTEAPFGQSAPLQTFKVGALEAILKGARVGIGFDGITWGRDNDMGYSDLLKTGAHFLVNLIRTDAVRLDLKSGYEFDQMSVNLAPETERQLAYQAVALRWSGKRFGARADARVFVNPSDDRSSGFQGSTGFHAKAIKASDFYLGIGFDFSYLYDPFRLNFGINPHLAIAGIYVDIGYERRRK